MAKRGAQFNHDPLRFLDQEFPNADDSIWGPGRQLFLRDAAAARAVLTNSEGLYEQHSDFFHTRRGLFGPRSLQVEISRSARTVLRAHLSAQAKELPETIRRELGPTSEWPDAGNWLIYHHLAPALVAPDSPDRLHRMLEEIVARAVLAGAKQRSSRLKRALFRYQAHGELRRAIEQRRAQGICRPADVLDVVISAASSEVPAQELAEVFLSFLFAAAGSAGFVLGWSLYLLGTYPHVCAEPAWVVREALRLWPVAWLLARHPARPHHVAGVEVTPQDDVIVCPYAVHRNPKHWKDPHSFRPERWAEEHDPQAFIPFGWGPHRCIAGTLTMNLVEDILRDLADGYRWTFTFHEDRPCVGAALAPPRFTLGLYPMGRDQQERR